MPPRTKLHAEVTAWVDKAKTDARAADHALTATPPMRDIALFHYQQAAEKIIKAFLCFHEAEIPKTHSIADLGFRAAQIDPTLEPTLRNATALSAYATAFRYPGELDEPDETDVLEAKAAVTPLFSEIQKRLAQGV